MKIIIVLFWVFIILGGFMIIRSFGFIVYNERYNIKVVNNSISVEYFLWYNGGIRTYSIKHNLKEEQVDSVKNAMHEQGIKDLLMYKKLN